jgi:hypothetical protein
MRLGWPLSVGIGGRIPSESAQGRDADLKPARRQVDRAKTTAVARDSGTAMPHAAKPAKGPVPIGVATAAARSKAKG